MAPTSSHHLSGVEIDRYLSKPRKRELLDTILEQIKNSPLRPNSELAMEQANGLHRATNRLGGTRTAKEAQDAKIKGYSRHRSQKTMEAILRIWADIVHAITSANRLCEFQPSRGDAANYQTCLLYTSPSPRDS